MNILIMRHGTAESLIVNDPQRALSSVGVSEARSMAPVINNICQNVDRVYVSSYLRAQQTFQQLQVAGLNSAAPITTNDIIPDASARLFRDFAAVDIAENNIQNLLLVSHMPIVSYLVEAFTTPGNTPIFATASIAHIEFDPATSQGKLVDLLAPQVELQTLMGR